MNVPDYPKNLVIILAVFIAWTLLAISVGYLLSTFISYIGIDFFGLTAFMVAITVLAALLTRPSSDNLEE